MISKGTRVETAKPFKGEIKYGVVSKGGRKPVVILDGGITTLTASHQCFKLSTNPLPTDPASGMDNWGIVGYKTSAFASHETECFELKVTHNNKAVVHVSNDGQGGSDMVYPLGDPSDGYTSKFETVVSAWAKANGALQDIIDNGVIGEWLNYHRDYRPYGVLSVDFWKDQNTQWLQWFPEAK